MKKKMQHHQGHTHHLHKPVHHTLAYIILGAAVLLFLMLLSSSSQPPSSEAAAARDEFGYNYNARLFSGVADGVDRNSDGTFWGDATYAKDHLVMKWSKAWDDARFNGAPWTCDAWTSNEWNGKNPGGSGEVWHYKIVWVGPTLQNSTCWHEGGYPVWGEFEVIMSQGTVANQHFWDAHAKSPGYGMMK